MLRPTRSSLVALILALPALVGCGLSPVGTTIPYDPSDGVSASVGQVQVRNLLIVGSTADQPGVASGVLLNDGAEPVTVTLSTATSPPVPVYVPAGGSVQLGVAGPAATPAPGTAGTAVVQFAALGQPAGAVVPVTLSSPSGGTTTVQVPVLAATLEYATITPTAG